MYEYFECPTCHAFYRKAKPYNSELDNNGELFVDYLCGCGAEIEIKWASNVYLVYSQLKEKEDGKHD